MTDADLARMPQQALTEWLQIYEQGCVDGYQRGWEAAEQNMAAQWRKTHQTVQQTARNPSYAELCERRGEPERAERQRQLLRERGIE